jgi:acyl-CoA synthetase (AMP-forming)/AMP-acid ligase II
VLHTLNPRLHPDQIAWIANHAEDQVLCFDMSFLPIVKAVHSRCTTVKHYVALCDADKLPADSGIPGLQSYEAWMAPSPAHYQWPSFDENSASSMCYTSGTTGNPKAACTATAPPCCMPMPALARCAEHERARHGVAGGAHVPRQRLGHCRIRPP